MVRHQQTTEDLFEKLSNIETDWKDDFSERVIIFLDKIPNENVTNDDLVKLLEEDFEAAITVFRLFLEKSKDEYTGEVKELFGKEKGSGKTAFLHDKSGYVETLNHFLLRNKIIEIINRKYTWKDILVERLKAGRGSAIKGQKRGRKVEDFTENVVKKVFSSYDVQCSFLGKNGLSTEKADVAIPSKGNPNIIIEVKAYGATGSKQTDVIGDIRKIIEEKRHDTTFLLVTDGITWLSRQNDFRKLVKFQNEGYIYRIYTTSMENDLLSDLKQLKQELNLY